MVTDINLPSNSAKYVGPSSLSQACWEKKRDLPRVSSHEYLWAHARTQTDTEVMIAQCESGGMGREEEGYMDWEYSLSA